MAGEGVEVAGGFEPENTGDGLLEPGAGGERRGSVLFGKLGKRGAEMIKFGCDDV